MNHPKAQSFWTAPRSTVVRRVAFQVHLWTGLLVGLYVITVSLTGSALVIRDFAERQISPGLFHVERTERAASLDAILESVRAHFPASPIQGIDNLQDAGEPLIFYLDSKAAPEAQLLVYADRSSGRVLGSQPRFGGFFGRCADLHYYLLSGESGYLVNGVLAIAFLLVCLTGWLLWWPGIRRLRTGFRISWRARWKRLNFDLHAVGGFFSNPALIVVVLTGIYFVFPKPILYALAAISGDSKETVDTYFSTPVSRVTGAKLHTSIDTALIQISRQLPAGTALRYLALPNGQTGVFDGIAYRAKLPPYSEPVHVYLDRYSGAVLRVEDTSRFHWGLRYSTFVYALHFGSFAGTYSRILWFLLGLLAAGLMITGFILYWNRFLSARWRQPRSYSFLKAGGTT